MRWYKAAWASVHPSKVEGIELCAKLMAVTFTGRSDHGATVWATYELLREAARKGYLRLFQEPMLQEVQP